MARWGRRRGQACWMRVSSAPVPLRNGLSFDIDLRVTAYEIALRMAANSSRV